MRMTALAKTKMTGKPRPASPKPAKPAKAEPAKPKSKPRARRA